MKTLTKNNLSLYLLEDNVDVVMQTDKIIVGDPPQFIIADCNSNNTVLHEGVTSPAKWIGHKYKYNGTEWELNPNFIEPNFFIES